MVFERTKQKEHSRSDVSGKLDSCTNRNYVLTYSMLNESDCKTIVKSMRSEPLPRIILHWINGGIPSRTSVESHEKTFSHKLTKAHATPPSPNPTVPTPGQMHSILMHPTRFSITSKPFKLSFRMKIMLMFTNMKLTSC